MQSLLLKYEIRSLLFAPNWFYLPLLGPKIPCLSIVSITYLHLPVFTYIWPNAAFIILIWSYWSLIIAETAPLWHILEQSDNNSWTYCTFQRIGGIQKVLSRIQFMCLSSLWHLLYVTSDALPLYQILKQSDNCLWYIIFIYIIFQRFGDTAIVVANAVILVFGESNFNTNVPLGDIYPPIKLYCNALGIANVMHFKVIADVHTHRQTNERNFAKCWKIVTLILSVTCQVQKSRWWRYEETW